MTKENWDAITFPESEKDLLVLRERAIRGLAALTPSLPVKCKEDELPDYLGFARAILCQEVVDRLTRQDENDFVGVFQAVLFSSLRIFDAHRAQMAQAREDGYHVNVAMETVLDVLDLSGVALLFSELNGSGFYGAVTQIWDGYLAAGGNKPRATIGLLLAVIDAKLRLPIMSPLGQARHDRHRAFVDAMGNMGLRVDGYDEPWGPKPTPHKSIIIRTW